MPTANFNLPLYGASDTAALDTLLNGQSNAIDAALAANSNRLIGTDAQRIALTAPKRKEGLTWYSTDTDKEWEYNGTTWQSYDSGSFLLTPTSVGGATIDSAGRIIPSASVTDVNVNGVFSSRFRTYNIEYYSYSSATTSIPRFRFRNAGANISANYNAQYTSSSGSGVTASLDGGATAVSLPATAGTYHHITFTILNPGHSGTQQLSMGQWTSTSVNPAMGFRTGGFYLGGSETSTQDGFTIDISGGTFSSTLGSLIIVRGIA